MVSHTNFCQSFHLTLSNSTQQAKAGALGAGEKGEEERSNQVTPRHVAWDERDNAALDRLTLSLEALGLISKFRRVRVFMPGEEAYCTRIRLQGTEAFIPQMCMVMLQDKSDQAHYV